MRLLTRREYDCLYWVAIGKSSWEIGKIMGITKRTVNFHVQNACVKLDACNRQAAVTKLFYPNLLSSVNEETQLKYYKNYLSPTDL